MDTLLSFFADLKSGAPWVFWWVMFMGAVFTLSIPFAFHRNEARWAAFVMILSFPAMMWLYSQIGYVRLLGIVHIVLWTPLLVYLWKRRDSWRVQETIAGKWVLLLFATITVSLLFDYADVVRYVAGDRG